MTQERAETGASLPIADEECPPVVPINKGGSDRRNQDGESSRHPARAAALALAKSRSTAFKRKGGEERSDVHHLTGLGRCAPQRCRGKKDIFPLPRLCVLSYEAVDDGDHDDHDLDLALWWDG